METKLETMPEKPETPPEGTPAVESAAAGVAAPEPPRFVGGKPRSLTIPLDWPLEYDGKVYSEVTIRRVTIAELETFLAEAIQTIEADGKYYPWPPMFDAPRAVMDALDPDDQDRISTAALDFFPRRLLELATPAAGATQEPIPAQPPAPGAATPPLSPQPSGGRATP
jgi:hypothetical protein